MKKILYVGCSFTENCGFSGENIAQFHWPHLLAEFLDARYHNAGIGGSSNEEIFFRTVETISRDKFDLVVIMWSSIGRKWVYFGDRNVDDYTMINNGVCKGFQSDHCEIKEYAKLHHGYFNNAYVDIKKWLCMILSLQEMLDRQETDFIFIKGFENFIHDFRSVTYDQQQGFNQCVEPLKQLLDFDNRPDWYIQQKISSIQQLMAKVNHDRWLNFHDSSFDDMAVDTADDGRHPGPLTNHALVEMLKIHCDKNLIMR